MDSTKLDKWADLLLDTGKRNNLVNFRDSKASTVEVIAPSYEDIFAKASNGSTFEVFDPKIAVEDELDNPTPKKILTKSEYFEKYSKKLKKQNQILVYNQDSNPVLAIKNIAKKAKSAIDETGVNIAYMAFGFIYWKEANEKELTYRAPILLVPVLFSRKSNIDPFRIEMVDDDIIVNPTFAFKLLQEQGIHLPEYKDEPIKEYLVKIASIVSKLGWKVASSCKIGTFSFLKINMYRDLKDNQEKILQNNNIRALLGEDVPSMNEGIDIQKAKSIDLLELHNVVDADSSQGEAIALVKNGQSFVLQGPPGTGKSQTITNIIAECLSDGKKVLFVSEKLAALEVVYDKLSKAGLAEFCLELHSQKANKTEFIDELVHTLRLNKSEVSAKAENEKQEKKRNQKALDDYVKELHMQRPLINRSLYELYEEVSACRNVGPVTYVIEDIQNKGEDYINKVIAILQRYVAYTQTIGFNYKDNIWYGYRNLDTSFKAKQEITQDLIATYKGLTQISKLAKNIEQRFKVECNTLDRYFDYVKFMKMVSKSKVMTTALIKKRDLDETLEYAKTMLTLANESSEVKAKIEEKYDEDIYKIQANSAYKKLTKQFTSAFGRAFSKEYKNIVMQLKLARINGKKVKYKEAIEDLALLERFQKAEREFNILDDKIKPYFASGYKGILSDWNEIVEEIALLKGLKDKGVSFGDLEFYNQEGWEISKDYFKEHLAKTTEIFSNYKAAYERCLSYFDKDEYNLLTQDLDVVISKIKRCNENIDKIDNWVNFIGVLDELKELNHLDFIDYAIENKIQVNKIITTYKKAFYTQWVYYILQTNEILSNFSRVTQDKAVEIFSEKDTLQFEINKAEIKAKISAKRPSLDMIAPGSAIAILQREAEKKRKKMNIRTLLNEISDLVLEIKPCFLMSPLSVSTYLSSGDIQFDIVIFDEASQIFPQDAIGAIYRGKQLIVVGDSKQMPPSNFFNTMVETDEEVEDISDFESILDLCSVTLPQVRLKWHYRSRYEELISFSNKNFYDNALVTFPSSTKEKQGIGVDYYHVDGVFAHKARTNRKEAEFVADLVYKNFEKYPNRSIGVVAFSIAQQELIERILDKKRREDPRFEDQFKGVNNEPFFIKNLETVQGDERDTIIFSIAYAKDETGKLLHNFGPLSREGGERRLNVAVTRAKQNVQLVSSMHYSDIDLNRTNSVGAKLLREYLDYAENGELALTRNSGVNPFEKRQSSFEDEVYDFLKENGFVVEKQVGCSSFKIDLAVRNPETEDYVLAIECDGRTYNKSKSARDRDRLRREVLERMGWSVYRIWSTDWFKSKSLEKDRLFKACKEALKKIKPKAVKPAKEKDAPSFEMVKKADHFKFETYRYADVDALRNKYKTTQSFVKAIMLVEAPLSEDMLLKRIAHLFNYEKVTATFKKKFDEEMVNCEWKGIIRKNGFLWLEGQSVVHLRVPKEGDAPRDVKHICIAELADGVYQLVKLNVSAEKNGVYKTLANQLGFARVGESMIKRFDRALIALKDKIDIVDNMLSIKVK